MRRVPKLVLSALVALSVALGVAPATALAKGTNLPSADDNGVITLTENVTLSEAYIVKDNNNVTIDLAGHELNFDGNGGVFLDVRSGSLTIRDSQGTGVVKVNEPYNGTGSDGHTQTIRCVQVYAGATFTLEGGTLTNTNSDFQATQVISNYGTTNIKGGKVAGITGIFMFAPSLGNKAWANNVATCNVSGGEIIGIQCTSNTGQTEGDYAGWNYGVVIYGPGTADDGSVNNKTAILNISGGTIAAGQGIGTNANGGKWAGYTLNMTGGTVIGTNNATDTEITADATGMYLPAIGVNNISGGTVTGAQGIRICAGELNVTGGTVTGTALSDNTDLVAGGSGGTTGAIVVGKASSGYTGSIEVNVSQNAVVKNIAESEDETVAPAIVVSDKNMSNAEYGYDALSISVSVNGGTVTGDVVKISNVTAGSSTQDGGSTSLEITGGTVTGNVINQTSEGDLSVVGATVSGNVTNESSGSVTLSQATVGGDVKNTSTGDVLINERSQVDGGVSNAGSGSVAIVNSTVTGEATGSGTTTIVNSTVNGSSSTTNPGNNVALVGGKTYTDLQAAVREAKNGDTVTLLQDVTLDGAGKMNNSGILLINDKSITLDGNGKTITAKNVTVETGTANGPSMINIQGGANVTVKNLTIDGAGSDNSVTTDNTKHGLNVYGPGTAVTVENVTIKNGNGYAIVANGSTATINGLTTENNGWGGINVDSKSGAAKLTINDATVKEANSVKIENSPSGNVPSTNEDPVTEIKGGTFQYITKGYEITKPNLTVYGGKFATGTTLDGAINVNDYLASGLAIDGNGNVYTPSHGGGSVATTYTVTVAKAENGKVAVSATSVSAGERVTVTATPAEGHEVASVSVTCGDEQVEVTDNADGTYAFEMPAGDVTVTVTFGASAPVVELPFTDVAEGSWYRGAVAFVYAKGLMTGYEGTTLFGPEDALGREQAAAVLHRALGAGEHAGDCGLADVDQAAWYAQPVNWAVETGLITGYGDGSGLFGVGDALTRDQFAAIVARVAKADLSKADPSALGGFSDGDEVAEWAVPAVSWAVQVGILEGSPDGEGGTELRASAQITRGEMAAMVMRAAEAGLLPTA